MERQQILNNIAKFFGKETYPKGIELFISSADHIFDSKEAITELSYEKWDQIPQEVLVKNRDRMTYLTDTGFLFLLPAFLTMAINHPTQADVLKDNIVHMLIPPSSTKILEYETFMKRSQKLSMEQSEVILEFFEAYTAMFPPDRWSFNSSDKEQIDRAIQFWRSKTTQNTSE